MSRFLAGILIYSQFVGTSSAFADAGFYIVKKGDTFSEIIWHKVGSPLCGKNGNLSKLISLNSHIKNPHKIKPGQKIMFEQPRTIAQDDISAESPEEVIVEKPESSEASVSKENLDPYSSYSIAPSFYFSTINGKESSNSTKAELVSNLNFVVNGTWSQNWSNKFSTSLQASIRREEYYSFEGITLDNKSLIQGSFGVGARYKFSDKFTFKSLLGYSQETFYRATSINTLAIESVALPKLMMGVGAKLFKIHQYELNFNAQGIATASAKSGEYDIELGTGYRTSLEFSEEFVKSNKSFGCDIFYSSLSQDSGLVDQTKKEVGAGCALSWRVGEVK